MSDNPAPLAEYVCIGYRNPNVALILHSAAQHGKWQCKEMCVPVYEKRHNDGDGCAAVAGQSDD